MDRLIPKKKEYNPRSNRLQVRRVSAYKKRIRIVRITIVSLVTLVCAGVLLYASLTPRLFIREVTVSGARDEYNVLVQKKIQERLEQKKFFIFSEKNILVFSRAKIEKDILQTITHIGEIHIDITHRRALNVHIRERVPLLYIEQDLSPRTLFLATDCVVYEGPLSDTSGLISVHERGEAIASRLTLPQGGASLSTALPYDFTGHIGAVPREGLCEKIEEFKQEVSSRGFTPLHLVLYQHGDAEIFVQTVDGGPGSSFRVPLFADIHKLFTSFDAAAASDIMKKEFEQNKTFFGYIDLRFGNKVFYTHKAHVSTPVGTPMSTGGEAATLH